MKLNARALGFTFGVIWGLCILIVTLISVWTERAYGRTFLYAVGSVYPGYDITRGGALLGLCYGFVDGFVCGWIIAKIYNFFSKDR